MSYKSQNKLISIINEYITCTIITAIHICRAWSLMADNDRHFDHEQVSICVRIVNFNGHVSEHRLACQPAPGTTAEDLYGVVMSVLQFRDVSFDRLIAQAYDGAFYMSGCYNGLQSLIQTRINPNISVAYPGRGGGGCSGCLSTPHGLPNKGIGPEADCPPPPHFSYIGPEVDCPPPPPPPPPPHHYFSYGV